MTSSFTSPRPSFTSPIVGRQRGFTLIEVLIASIIFGVGLMGLAGLQTLALQSNHSTWQKNAATLLAHNFFERLRANPTAALSPDDGASYVSPSSGWSATTLADLNPSLAANLCQDNHSCSPAELRQHDLWFWIGRPHMLARLPSARAIVERTPAGSGYWYTVAVEWEDSFTPSTSDTLPMERLVFQTLVLPPVVTQRSAT